VDQAADLRRSHFGRDGGHGDDGVATVGRQQIALYVLAGWGILGALFSVLVIYIILRSGFNQWVLRKRGTDTQWLWFSGEPKGLARQREDLSD